MRTPDLRRKHGRSAATFYGWKSKFGGMDVSEAQKLKAMEDENRRLKQLVADLSLDKEALKSVIRKTAGASTPQTKDCLWGPRLAGLRAEVAFVQTEHVLGERRACKLLAMERSSYRYDPRPDRNAELRGELVRLARQKPRSGYLRLHALLSRRGHEINVKRVHKLYVNEKLMVPRNRRKRLVREHAIEPRLVRANQEWTMDFITDGLATGRMVRILNVVDA